MDAKLHNVLSHQSLERIWLHLPVSYDPGWEDDFSTPRGGYDTRKGDAECYDHSTLR